MAVSMSSPPTLHSSHPYLPANKLSQKNHDLPGYSQGIGLDFSLDVRMGNFLIGRLASSVWLYNSTMSIQNAFLSSLSTASSMVWCINSGTSCHLPSFAASLMLLPISSSAAQPFKVRRRGFKVDFFFILSGFQLECAPVITQN